MNNFITFPCQPLVWQWINKLKQSYKFNHMISAGLLVNRKIYNWSIVLSLEKLEGIIVPSNQEPYTVHLFHQMNSWYIERIFLNKFNAINTSYGSKKRKQKRKKMPTSSTSSMISNGHKISNRSTTSGSCSPSPSLTSLSPKTSLVYRSGSLSPKTSVGSYGYNGNYGNFAYYGDGNFYHQRNGSVGSNGSPMNGQNGASGNSNGGTSPSNVNHNSCILVNGGQRKLSNSYLRFQRRYSKHG